MLVTMSMTWLTSVVIAANLLGAAMAVPQARKLLQSRRIEGVSLSWATVSAVVNAWWGVYGLAIRDVSIVPVSLVSVMAYTVIAVSVVRFSPAGARSHQWRAAGVAALVAVVPAAAWWLGGWPMAGIALGALYGIQLSPAVASVYRTADVRGVSIATWVIAFVEAGLWGVYGVASIDAGLVTLAVTGVTMSGLVLVRLAMRRPRRRPAVATRQPAFATA